MMVPAAGVTFNLIQSQVAIGSGGFGVRVGVTVPRFRQFSTGTPHGLYFSVIGEELGFVGATFVLLLFLVLIYRSILIALRAKDLFGTLIVPGLSPCLFFILRLMWA